jgi:hypothetical protein
LTCPVIKTVWLANDIPLFKVIAIFYDALLCVEEDKCRDILRSSWPLQIHSSHHCTCPMGGFQDTLMHQVNCEFSGFYNIFHCKLIWNDGWPKQNTNSKVVSPYMNYLSIESQVRCTSFHSLYQSGYSKSSGYWLS